MRVAVRDEYVLGLRDDYPYDDGARAVFWVTLRWGGVHCRPGCLCASPHLTALRRKAPVLLSQTSQRHLLVDTRS